MIAASLWQLLLGKFKRLECCAPITPMCDS
jgi:hypothetical protein